MKKIALIGSTGSIGTQVLSVVSKHPDKFKVISISAGENKDLFLKQVKEFSPKVATLKSEIDVSQFNNTEFYFGKDAFLNAVISEADLVVVSLVGFTGLKAVIKAIELKKDVALANKESLVLGGKLVTSLAKQQGVKILPIDSEHSAVWQALNFDFNANFKKIILTASGGALRDWDLNSLKNARAKDALNHPNWVMGKKITVDCATLVNKAFEVVEAKWLFNASFENIEVVLHFESIIHSMVEFNDGAVMAQLSSPNMELPISLALSYPNRIETNVTPLNFVALGSLTFNDVDNERYPCFKTAVEAAKKGKAYSAVLNGANEKAVELFLKDKITFGQIEYALKKALDSFTGGDETTYQGLELAQSFGENIVLETF
ncbi:MAG: 1-deoxy-D-xylulose-5-phosphate reductoisomerase [Clostridia bacterium]|nr:1-deoxy-D-xylulose-5-phosphate reductoisomerase [Clostridia bacterium]